MSSDPFQTERTEIAPSVFLVTLSGSPSIEEFKSFLDSMGRWLQYRGESGRQVALVVDPSTLNRFDANMRQAYGEWRGANRDVIASGCTRAAYVAESKLWRGILTAVFWLAKPVIPVELCESRDASLAWLESQASE